MAMQMKAPDIYQSVTDTILAALERGVVPWHKRWDASRVAGGRRLIGPRNAVTRRPYRGVNVLLLACTPYRDPRWLTRKQAVGLGGTVCRGERGTGIVFYKPGAAFAVEDAETGERGVRMGRPVLVGHEVFNVEQCDGLGLAPLEVVPEPEPAEQIAAAEAIVAGFPAPAPPIVHEGPLGGALDASYYEHSTAGHETIRIPDPRAFDAPAYYYSVLFHELTHATGHPTRLNRQSSPASAVGHKARRKRAREELTAELGAAFLCAEAGIVADTMDDHTAYIANWRQALTDDDQAIVYAAQRAQKAADYILGVSGATHAGEAAPANAVPLQRAA